MRKLSIFVFCFFISVAAVKAQEQAPQTDKPAAPKKTTTTATKKKGSKTTKAAKPPVAEVPPPPPANMPAPIPVPMADRPPVPADPHAVPPPPPGTELPAPVAPVPPKHRGAKGDLHNHEHLPAGQPTGANLPNPSKLPPTPPGLPAPPRPYDPSVDNVPVGPNAGVFQFKEETHDFGQFTEGPTVETDFEFTNVGKEPITIKQAFGSCGCTIPTPPKEPIYPGKTGKIHVTFNSKGRVGLIHKDVTIVSNAKQQPMVVHIAGEVKAAH